MKIQFSQIKPLETFIIKDNFGDAGFMKRFNHKSICLHSQEATYEKSREYYISDEQIVIKTC